MPSGVIWFQFTLLLRSSAKTLDFVTTWFLGNESFPKFLDPVEADRSYSPPQLILNLMALNFIWNAKYCQQQNFSLCFITFFFCKILTLDYLIPLYILSILSEPLCTYFTSFLKKYFFFFFNCPENTYLFVTVQDKLVLHILPLHFQSMFQRYLFAVSVEHQHPEKSENFNFPINTQQE